MSLSFRSGDAENRHHPGHLVVGDVAMEHPVAGVVGYKRDFDRLARRHQHRIPPFPTWVRFAIAADYAEAMPVQMHRVPPCSLVVQPQHTALVTLERNERLHFRLAVTGHGHAVHSPSSAAHIAHHRHTAHHPRATPHHSHATTHHPHSAHHAAL